MAYLFIIALLIATAIVTYFLGRLFGSLVLRVDKKLNRTELHTKYGRWLSTLMAITYLGSFIVYLSINVTLILYILHLIKSILGKGNV
jgi:hypothetical protein